VPPAGTALKWTDILRGFKNNTPGQDGRRNIVKYDSPAFAGFTVSASWHEDDLWDAALLYKSDIGDFTVAARVGYGESSDEAATRCGGRFDDFKCRWGGAATTVLHKPTGLYVYTGWGSRMIDNAFFAAGLDDTSTTWFVQPGIEHKWFKLGKTTIYGEYRHDDSGASLSTTNAVLSRGADIDFWAGGIVQGIEAADMIVYAVYRHTDGSFRLGTPGALGAAGTKISLDDFDMVITGAKINF
jgi:porin-like protein